jgi:hypothetical protein
MWWNIELCEQGSMLCDEISSYVNQGNYMTTNILTCVFLEEQRSSKLSSQKKARAILHRYQCALITNKRSKVNKHTI